MVYHIPALLDESIEGLNIRPGGIYVDVTFGGGGHSREILSRLEAGRLFGFDQDEDAEINRPVDDRFVFINQNFRFLKDSLRLHGITEVDGIIADLGVSFHQFDEPERGFTFHGEAPLDMRMDKGGKKKAADIVNTYDADSLSRIMKEWGELYNTDRIASTIIKAREVSPINSAGDLIAAVNKFAPRGQENKFYAKLFQALRIEVNREIEFLRKMLQQSLDVLKPGGRLSVITYHSLEDREVKNFFRSGNFEGAVETDFYGNRSSPFVLINRKIIVPGDEEIRKNSRSRSARLRIAEKV